MSNVATDVIAFLLTVKTYNEEQQLDEGDLAPEFRRVFWDNGAIERPIAATTERIRLATEVDRPWDAVRELMFTERDEFSGAIKLADHDMAESWFLERVDAEYLTGNPALAFAYGDAVEPPVDYEAAREDNRSIRADRVWIDGLLSEYFQEEEDEDMLDLVDVRAPEEIDMTLDDLVLTADQEGEIQKIVKAIEYRSYLGDIGLREIGKLLFVGPPGTGKTTASRALAEDLDLPFVEVKLSMITSQYLGETAKNVDKVFEVAKRLAPCILFIDEFDFVAKTRQSDEHAAIKRAVNTLLKSIDEVSLIRDEVLLIGATNHPEDLDAAAWRRFDEIVHFPRPDIDMREEILEVITRRMDITDFDPAEIAEETEGLTGSDLRLVMREAVLDALTENRRALTQRDLLDAVEDFEERNVLRSTDMLKDEPEALVAGGHDHSHDHDHD